MKNFILLCALIPALCFGQGKTHMTSVNSAYGNGIQWLTQYSPNDSVTGPAHPVILCAEGQGEINTFNSASGSIGAYIHSAKGLPPFYNAIYKRYSTFYVVQIHKLANYHGEFESTRYKDALAYALKLPNVDASQIFATGLSLSGGAVWALCQEVTDSTLFKLAAVGMMSGIQDADDKKLCAGLGASGIPFIAYDAVNDENQQSRGAFTHYKALGDYGICPAIKNQGIFKEVASGGHGGGWIQGYDTTHAVSNPNFYEWCLLHQRKNYAPPVVIPPVVIPPVVVPPVVVPPAKVTVGSFGLYNDAGLLLFTITVYSDGTTSTVFNK